MRKAPQRIIFVLATLFVVVCALVFLIKFNRFDVESLDSFAEVKTYDESICEVKLGDYFFSKEVDFLEQKSSADNLSIDDTVNESDNDHKVLKGWIISLGVIGGFILILSIAYILLFFVFNKWIVVNRKPARAFVIGKKNNKIRLLNASCMVVYRYEVEIFDKKADVVVVD